MRLNIESAMAEKGNSFGISLKNLQEVRGDLAAVQNEYLSAAEAGLIPFSQNLEEKRAQAKKWQEEFLAVDEVWIIGEPSILLALQLVLEKNDTENKFRWISSADPRNFVSLDDKTKKRLALLLTSLGWGRQLIKLLASSFQKIIICAGDGTEDTPDNLEKNEEELIFFEEGIADSRFALFSSLAFSLLEDVDQAVNEFSATIQELERKGMWENPSALLACCLKSVETESNPTQLLLVGARDCWSDWLRWAEMIWKGMGSIQRQVGGFQKQWYGAASSFVLGDELGINQLGINAKERLLCLFEEREPKISNITEEMVEIWNISNDQIEEFLAFVAQRQYPIMNIQIQKISGTELLRLSVSWVHMIMLLNALRGSNPLAMWGADQWRLFRATK